ncbi:hypothetical protein TM902_140068 [Tenacibaculum maritimum]|uniref:hypothetical protein n=1 Tax=Tenacibaculum maritimum TaxID=107401 RepID=UPI0012E6EA07|nr:hypothetical protein [Tenacibaculum maritimum]CAA0144332.1 hypothetical protein TM902_140068 [Tenacibaculum maritimum]CAA0195807.1 hypothetical protein JIP32914_220016 [Tenacibaculum maritimum]
MNKSQSNTLLVIAGTILALISLSMLCFSSKEKKRKPLGNYDDGFNEDKESFSTDLENISSDMKRAAEKLSHES